MGQRLVVSLIEHDKCIAKAYFHWSAYSISALYETENILKGMNGDEDFEGNVPDDLSIPDIKDTRLRFIRTIEAMGGGVDREDYEYVCKTFPDEQFATGRSRDNGLVAISEEDMQDMQGWSEGDVIINLDTQMVTNHVIYVYEDEKEYKEDYGYDDEDDKKIPNIDGPDIQNIPFNKVSEVKEFLEYAETVSYCFKLNGNKECYQMIA